MLLSTNALAIGPAVSPANSQIPDMDEVESYALDYMKRAQNSETITVDRIQPFVDLNNNPTAYCISFNDAGRTAGFLFLSLLANGDPVVALGFDGHGPNDNIEKASGLRAMQTSDEDYIYTGPGCLYKRENREQLISLFSGEEISASAVESNYDDYLEETASLKGSNVRAAVTGEDPIDKGIINWPTGNVKSDTVYKLIGFGQGTDYWLMTDFAGNHDSVCAPTAATNIMWYWAMKRDRAYAKAPIKNISGNRKKAQAIYEEMYRAMWTSAKYGTWDTAVIDGYEKYIGAPAAVAWGYDTLKASASYSDFKNCLSRDIPVHLQVRMNSNPLTSKGHDMFAFGYASSTSGTRYLCVMNGWQSNGYLVKYDYYPVVKGYAVWVA